MQEFRSQYVEQARPRVMSQLIIDKIVREEKITAEDAEVEAKIAEQAASVEKSAADYKKSMDPRQLDYIRNDIIVTKLFDLLQSENEMYTEDGEKPAAKKPAAKKTTKKAE